MNDYVSALFANQVTASDAVDRLMAAGVELSEINVIVSAASRAQTGRRINVERHGEVFVAGPLAADLSNGHRRDRTREELDALFDSLSHGDDTLTDTFEDGAVIIAVPMTAALRAGAERVLSMNAAAMSAGQAAR
jgi:hypothetical protein